MGSSLLLPTGQPGQMQDGEYVPISSPNVASFKLQEVNPPSIVYLQRDDTLSILCIGSIAGEVVTISGRLLRASDSQIIPFTFTHVMSATYTLDKDTFQLAEGYLLGLTVGAKQAVQYGQCFVHVFVSRGTVTTGPLAGVVQTLLADYVTANVNSGWPIGRAIQAATFPGARQVLSIANPAAGADFAATGNAHTYIRVLGMRALFTASGTVANRQIEFSFPGEGALRVVAPAAITAGQAINIYLGIGVGNYQAVTGSMVIQVPQGVIAAASGAAAALISSFTTGIQAGDQWSGIFIVFEECLFF